MMKRLTSLALVLCLLLSLMPSGLGEEVEVFAEVEEYEAFEETLLIPEKAEEEEPVRPAATAAPSEEAEPAAEAAEITEAAAEEAPRQGYVRLPAGIVLYPDAELAGPGRTLREDGVAVLTDADEAKGRVLYAYGGAAETAWLAAMDWAFLDAEETERYEAAGHAVTSGAWQLDELRFAEDAAPAEAEPEAAEEAAETEATVETEAAIETEETVLIEAEETEEALAEEEPIGEGIPEEAIETVEAEELLWIEEEEETAAEEEQAIEEAVEEEPSETELEEAYDPEAFREHQLEELFARLLPDRVEYNGEEGIIERGTVYLGMEYAYRLVTPEALAAYVKTNASMVFAGDTVTYTLYPYGGVDPYTYKMGLYFRRSDSEESSFYGVRATVKDNTISYNVPAADAGAFLLQAVVTDSAGNYVKFQSPVMHVARHDEASDINTVYGKAKAVVAEVIRDGMSDYEKALALHDWLIYHANYDYSYTYYYPDGVLLRGTGVCQSYALAYEILLQEAGVSSQYVSGGAGGGGHAWNLVKMDGDWYYVDCTWDDPGTGGYERHDYFGLTSEMLSADHDWGETDTAHSDPYRRWPELATATYYNYNYIAEGVPLLDSVTLSDTVLMMEREQLAQLTVTMSPAKNRHRALVWSSSDDSVVEVNQSGEIAALKTGKAVITCAESNGAHAAQCTVYVMSQSAEFTVSSDNTGEPWIELAWEESDVPFHVIWRTDDSGAVVVAAENVTGTSWRDTDVREGVTYTYRIAESYGDGVVGEPGEEQAAWLIPAPSITELTAENESTVTLSWDAAEGASSYLVYSVEGDGTLRLLGETDTAGWTDPAAAPRTRNTYAVQGKHGGFAGAMSQDSVYTFGVTEIASAVSFNWGSDAGIVLSWEGSEETKLKVWRSAGDGEMEWIANVMGNMFMDSFVQPGIIYTYQLTEAEDDKSWGPFSAPVQVCVIGSTSLSAEAADVDAVTFRLTEAGGASAYQIYCADSADGTYELLATAEGTSYTHSGLKPGAAYWFKAQPVNGPSFGPETEPVMVELEGVAQPAGVTAQPVDTNAALIRWEAVPSAAGYQVFRADGSSGDFKWIKNVDAATASNYQLKPGEDYRYRVRAYVTNAAGVKYYGPYSEAAAVHTPGAILNLSARGVDTNCARLTWDRAQGITGYQLFRTVAGSGEYTWVKNCTTPVVNNYSLTPGTVYYYKLRTYLDLPDGSRAYGPFSSGIKVQILPQAVLEAEADGAAAVLSWDRQYSVTGYQVFCLQEGTDGIYKWVTNCTPASATGTRITKNLTAGKNYWFRVRSYLEYEDGSRCYGQFSEAVRVRMPSLSLPAEPAEEGEPLRQSELDEIYAKYLPDVLEDMPYGEVFRGWVYNGNDLAYQQVTADYLYAYATSNTAFFYPGETARYTITAGGGVDPYTYEMRVYYVKDGAYHTVSGVKVSGNSCSFTVPQDATEIYRLAYVVTDAVGSTLAVYEWGTEVARHGDQYDPNTVLGKVKQIVASEIHSGMNDYQKALALHDWLIYNANYDYTYTNYRADGVLLKGTGVCESYALAYEVLLKEVGIPVQHVVGSGGDSPETAGGHAWNLVKLGGDWYHIDCTWDDPGTGGYEYHGYFGLTDEMLAEKNHYWAWTDLYYEPYDARTFPNQATATYYNYDYIAQGVPLLSSLKLNKSFIGCNPGDSETLTVTMSPTKNRRHALQWSSSDDSVVEVNQSGEIAALKSGTAVITCAESNGGHAVSCTVHVYGKASITGLSAVNDGDTRYVDITWPDAGGCNHNLYRADGTSGGFKLIAGNVEGGSYRDTGVVAGMTYRYELAETIGGSSEGMHSAARSVKLHASCSITKLIPGDGRVTVVWSASSTGSSYAVYAGSSPDNLTLRKTTTGTSWTETGLVMEGVRYYQIEVVAASGYSATRTKVYSVPLEAQSIPSITWINQGGYSADELSYTLYWSDEQASAYGVWRRAGSGSWTKLTEVDGTFWIDTEVTPEEVYTYRVTAIDGAGLESKPSAEVQARCLERPQLIAYALDCGTAELIWEQVPWADTYQIWAADDEGGYLYYIDSTSDNYYTHLNASPGRVMWYCVSPIYGIEEGLLSNMETVEMPDMTAPENITGRPVDTNASRIEWDRACGVTGYQLFRAPKEDGEYVWIKNNTTPEVNNYALTPGADYWYKVRCYVENIHGEKIYGPFSGSVHVHILGEIKRLTGRGADTNAVKLTWQKVSGATGYQIFRTVAGSGEYTWVKNNPTTEVNNYSLTPGTLYYYKVRAYVDLPGGKRAYGQFSEGIPVQVQDKSVVTATGQAGSALISWNAQKGVTGYQVFYALEGSGETKWYANVPAGSNSVVVKGLQSGRRYWFLVRSYVDNLDGSRAYGQMSEGKSAIIR